MRFFGTVALITGGGDGIGLASAQRLVREGARVVQWDISAQALEAAAAALGEQALCQQVDVTDEAQVGQAMAAAVAQMGRLDIVVNGAGIVGSTQPFWENEPAAWRKVLVNCITPSMIQRELVEQMPAAQRELVLSKVPMGRAGTVDEVAAMVCWLASDECSFSTGAVFDLSGGRASY